MYLSKLILNPTSYRVQKEIGNRYQLHRTIMNGFPDNLKDQNLNARVIFRVEDKDNPPSVLIQSILCPDWSFLQNEKYLFNHPLSKQFSYPSFLEGWKYFFRLFGNPTKRQNGKRIGMYKEEEQYIWLERKADISGFRLLHVSITQKNEITAKAKINSKPMTFYGVQFEGVLQVIDPDKFQKSLENGIGSGKAFGFGFLTISKF